MLDSLIIGCGASGLSCATALKKRGITNVLIVEGKSRVGGRVWTDFDIVDFPLELGAEFIHGEGAITHNLLSSYGLTSTSVDRKSNLLWADKDHPAKPASNNSKITQLIQDYNRIENKHFDVDLSLAEYLERHCGWKEKYIQVADVLLAQTCCAPIHNLSVADLKREMLMDKAGLKEYRIKEGYACMLDHMRKEISETPILFNTQVFKIEYTSQGVNVYATNQDSSTIMYQAKTVIITVSVGVLKSGAIQFSPPLPQQKQRAIDSLKMEAATKLIYVFSKSPRVLIPDNLTYMCHNGSAPRWWTPSYMRSESKYQVISSYITSHRASIIDALPESEALEIGLKELSTLLSIPQNELIQQLHFMKRVSWATDPLVQGGYAYCPPGTAIGNPDQKSVLVDARVELAQSVDGVLFFAGEATAHFSNPQTVHGAIESGILAAQRIVESMKHMNHNCNSKL